MKFTPIREADRKVTATNVDSRRFREWPTLEWRSTTFLQ